MDKTTRSTLNRLVDWFRGTADSADAVPVEVSRFQARLRHPSLVVDATRTRVERRENVKPHNHKEVVHSEAATIEHNHDDNHHQHHHAEAVQVAHTDAKHVPAEHNHHNPPAHTDHHAHGSVPAVEHGHGHAVAHAGHGDHHGHGHGGHGHHDVLVAQGTGGRLELHGNTLHLTKGGLFGFFVTMLGLHGGHAHQTIRVSDISAIEFEKHGLFFHYVRFCYPGAPKESGNHLHDMMADNALLMNMFDNRDLYRIKEKIEQSMEHKSA